MIINSLIDRQKIGQDSIPLFLADIGTFFNQDMKQAKELVTELSNVGLPVIKGEILHTANVCLDDKTTETYLDQKGNQVTESYRELIERKIVSLSSYEDLFLFCKNINLEFVVSVYDFEGLDFSKDMGAVAIKIASSNIVHQPLIEYASKMELPLILDTGKSTIEEIARAMNWMKDAGAKEIIIEHSPDAPPNSLQMHNLKFMQTLGSTFGVPYGLSDHHSSEEMLYAAVAMGASVIEKGVIPNNLNSDQDVYHALPIHKVGEVYKKCINISIALGNGVRNLHRRREKYKSRMGLIAKKELEKNETVNLSNVTFAWPARGIPVEFWEMVEGTKLKVQIKKGDIIRWTDVRY